MAQVSDVITCLLSYGDMTDCTQQQVETFCQRGLCWVEERLRADADGNSALAVATAAAMAHYLFFLSRLSQEDKLEAYTAGDLSIRRNLSKELLFEQQALNSALVCASSILKDGGFYCCGT